MSRNTYPYLIKQAYGLMDLANETARLQDEFIPLSEQPPQGFDAMTGYGVGWNDEGAGGEYNTAQSIPSKPFEPSNEDKLLPGENTPIRDFVSRVAKVPGKVAYGLASIPGSLASSFLYDENLQPLDVINNALKSIADLPNHLADQAQEAQLYLSIPEKQRTPEQNNQITKTAQELLLNSVGVVSGPAMATAGKITDVGFGAKRFKPEIIPKLEKTLDTLSSKEQLLIVEGVRKGSIPHGVETANLISNKWASVSKEGEIIPTKKAIELSEDLHGYKNYQVVKANEQLLKDAGKWVDPTNPTAPKEPLPPSINPKGAIPYEEAYPTPVPIGGNKTIDDLTPAEIEKLAQETIIGEKYEKMALPPSGTPPTSPVGVGGRWESDKELIDRLIAEVEGVKPLRGRQAGMIKKERGYRAYKGAQVGRETSGEAGFFKELGQLKGEYNKLELNSIRNKFSQSDIDRLFEVVKENKTLLYYESISARKGLQKLLGVEGGAIPYFSELKALAEVFPLELIEALLSKRAFGTRAWEMFSSAINLPRAVMATLDYSAPFRQGIFMIGYPKEFLPAFRDMFKASFKESNYLAVKQAIRENPLYEKMVRSGLSLTDIGFFNREEMFMSNLAEKIPGFGRLAKGSNRAYTGFLNKLRADSFTSLYWDAMRLHGEYVEVGGKMIKSLPEGMAEGIADFINAATGRGTLGSKAMRFSEATGGVLYRTKPALEKAGQVLNAMFFSPRLMQSRMKLLWPGTYIMMDKFTRLKALRALGSFIGAGFTILMLSKLAGADVSTDPFNADFGKVKIKGKTRYDVWGGFQQYFVLYSRLWSGRTTSSTTGKESKFGVGFMPRTRATAIQEFLENKFAPVASLVSHIIKGKNAAGGAVDIPAEVIDRFVPMVIQDAVDLYREYGLVGLPMAIPGVFGIGLSTYEKEEEKWKVDRTIGAAVMERLRGERTVLDWWKEKGYGFQTKHPEVREMLIEELEKKMGSRGLQVINDVRYKSASIKYKERVMIEVMMEFRNEAVASLLSQIKSPENKTKLIKIIKNEE